MRPQPLGFSVNRQGKMSTMATPPTCQSSLHVFHRNRSSRTAISDSVHSSGFSNTSSKRNQDGSGSRAKGHAKPPCNPMASVSGMGHYWRGSGRKGYGNLQRDEEIACEKIGIEMAERRCDTQFCP